MPKIYDISITLREGICVYPGDPEFKLETAAIIEKDGYELSKISMNSHTGTHIDAPAHFFPGKNNISELSLNILIGRVLVIDLSDKDYISSRDLQNIDFKDNSRIIFKTRNSEYINSNEFSKNYAYLESGEYLVQKGVKLVGFDYYTPDKYNSDMPVHKELLKNNVIILEGLNLYGIQAGEYELFALPIKLNAEGAPARAILREINPK